MFVWAYLGRALWDQWATTGYSGISQVDMKNHLWMGQLIFREHYRYMGKTRMFWNVPR